MRSNLLASQVTARAVRRGRPRGRSAGARRGPEPAARGGAGGRRASGSARSMRWPSPPGRASSAPSWWGWPRQGGVAGDRRPPGRGEPSRGPLLANFLEHGRPSPRRRADRERRTHDARAHARDAPPRRARPDARRRCGGGVRQGRSTDGARVPGGPALDAMAGRGIPTRSSSRGRWRTPATTTSR